MNRFVQRFSHIIKGTISGFDRIVFKGSFRHLMFAKGVASFLAPKGVLNKNYKDWMMPPPHACPPNGLNAREVAPALSPSAGVVLATPRQTCHPANDWGMFFEPLAKSFGLAEVVIGKRSCAA